MIFNNNKRAQLTSLLSLALLGILLFIAISFAAKIVQDVDNSYGDNTNAQNITEVGGRNLSLIAKNFPAIGMLLSGVIILFFLKELIK